MPEDADATLMLAFQRGDSSAFRTLYERHARAMVGFCRHFVRDGARAEELAQDVFVKLFRAAGRYRPDARFKTFLYRIASNHCLNELRRGEYEARPPASATPGDPRDAADDLPSREASPLQVAEAKALEAAVREVLDRLPDKQRAAFVLCRFEGLSYEEIAEALGTTVAAVKALVHRATVAAAAALAPFAPAGSREAV
jgi:RNA polymerase sigma-70 factor (ECF subfamily)